MKIKRSYLALAVLIIFFGSIFVSQGLGLWHTTTTKEVAKTASGEADPGDIRGSYSLDDISSNFEISVDTLLRAFSVQGDGSFEVKQLEEMYSGLEGDVEIGTASVRYFVSLYTGIESTLAAETYIPKAAADILLSEGKISQEKYDQLAPLIIDLSNIEIPETPAVVEKDEENYIKGSTTFAQAIAYGITQEQLEEVLGFKIENKALKIKDVCIEKGLTFEDVKTQLNELIASMQ